MCCVLTLPLPVRRQTTKRVENEEEQQEQSEPRKEGRSALQGLHVRRLLRRFLGGYDPMVEEDQWQHVASVLHNVSQLQVRMRGSGLGEKTFGLGWVEW